MEETGVVIGVHDVHATVRVDKKSACDQCKVGCKVSGEGADIEAVNLAKAQVGQTVMVRMMPYTYLKGSLLVYGLPALSLIVGAVIGREWLAGFFPGADRDLIAAVAGFAACILAFLFARFISARAEKNVKYQPVVEKIL